MKIFKNNRLLSLILSLTLLQAACKKDFLDRTPQTSITEKNYFKTPSDLETYSNTFYDNLSASYNDIGSDNISSYSGGSEVQSVLNNTLSPANVGSWDDWSQLRTYNYMLDNVSSVSGDSGTINHYVGIARFFRALFYFNKIKRYSDVPWVNHAPTNDDTVLYLPNTPRQIVADSILADLQFAVDHISSSLGDKTRVNKYSALALMSRFCLYEGTFRKYHAELNLSDQYAIFLQKAVTASNQLIKANVFSIYNTGAVGKDYSALFNSASLANNNEIIQWQASSSSLGKGNNSHTVLGWTWSLSKSLEESYLMSDGSRFTSKDHYDTIGFVNTFKSRDPRMKETIAYPGYAVNNDSSYYLPKPNLGGFDQLKFYPREAALRGGWNLDYTGLPLFRYGEILLNYIEAKAELGDDITQTDIDISINKLRDRVDMPHMELAPSISNIDPYLEKYYPNVTSSNKGLILEIRRERRVELACEGLRLDDLQRWYAGKRIEDAQQGIYIQKLGAYDVTGDGLPDIALLPNPSDSSALIALSAIQRKNIKSIYYLVSADGVANNFYLTHATYGNIVFTVDRDNTRIFDEPKDYYRPIPQNQLVLNPNLKQPYGW